MGGLFVLVVLAFLWVDYLCEIMSNFNDRFVVRFVVYFCHHIFFTIIMILILSYINAPKKWIGASFFLGSLQPTLKGMLQSVWFGVPKKFHQSHWSSGGTSHPSERWTHPCAMWKSRIFTRLRVALLRRGVEIWFLTQWLFSSLLIVQVEA